MTDIAAHQSSARDMVPVSIEAALDPDWLATMLAPISGGSRIGSVEVTDVLTTVASKVRIAVRFENEPEHVHAFCIKAIMTGDETGTDPTTLREADFYRQVAPRITMRTPRVAAFAIDRETPRGMLIMDDLIVAGAHFCSALEPFTPDLVAETLDQLARLHAGSRLLQSLDWIPNSAERLAREPYFGEEHVQRLLDDQRGEPLAARTRSAAVLHRSLKALAERNRSRPQMLLHGDCHAGNVYLTADGPGFTDWQCLQRGNWAMDVAYHICAVLPIEVAEREERRLVEHYVDRLRAHGGEALSREEAWEDYRAAQNYGFYQWAITRFQPRDVIDTFTARLGAGVERHGTYALLRV